MKTTTDVATPTGTSTGIPGAVTDEIVIEEVSIDGMCGVY